MEEDIYKEKPWMKTYELTCTSKTFKPYPDIAYTEFHLDEPAKKWPENIALVQFDYEMRYKDLKNHVDRFATALADLGIKKGDVVMTLLPTSIQFEICDMAIPEIGAIHLPGTMLDSVDEIVNKIERTNCKTIVSVHTNIKNKDIINKVKDITKRVDVENIIVTMTEDYSKNPPRHEDEKGVIWLTDLIKKYPPNLPKVDIDPENDVAVLFFTGGTTGTPKGVMLSHKGLVAHTIQFMGSAFPPALIPIIEGGFLRVAVPLPLFHVYGHAMIPAFMHYGSMILLQKDPRDVKEYVRLAKKYHPSLTIAAPTQYMKIAKEGGEEARGLGTIGGSGSMALAPETQREFEEKTQSLTFEGYGLSEFAPVTHAGSMAVLLAPILGSKETAGKVFHLLDKIISTPGMVFIIRSILSLIGPDNLGKTTSSLLKIASSILTSPEGRKKESFRSIGLPFVDTDMKIINEDTGEKIPISRVVQEGLRGEMCLDGPQKMLGYWPNRGSGFDEEGYVHTGDIVTVDEKGYTYIVDRTKDMVNVSGYKVYTREIDDLLYEYPGVEEAAVIGVPDPDRPGSERVKAFIVPHQGIEIKEEDIIEYLKERVPPYAIPKEVEIRKKMLPRTPTEKIFKRKLREMEIEKMKKKGLLK